MNYYCMNYLINYFIDKIGKRFDEMLYEVIELQDELEELFDRLDGPQDPDGLDELRLIRYLKGLKNCDFAMHLWTNSVLV